MASIRQKFLRHNLVLPITLAVLLFLFITFALIYFYAPKYVESKILPEIAQKAGISNLRCDVRRIGLTGLDLGGLYVGDPDEPSISIESVRIDYSIRGLLRKHINSVVIAGVEFNCEFSNGEFIIPGINWQSSSAEQKPDNEVPADDLQIPISVGSLKICNAVFVCGYNGQSYRIPFDLLVVAKEENLNELECTLRLYPREQKLTLSSSINLPDRKALLKFHFDSFNLDRFEDIAGLLPCMKISGDIEAACNLQSSLWAIESSGRFFITLEQSNRNQHCPLQVLEPVNTAGEFTAKFAQTGEWEFNFSNATNPVEDCKIRFNTMDIISKLPGFTISGEGAESKGTVKYTTNLYDFNLVQENATIKVPSLLLTGNANLDSKFKEVTADFELKISDTDVSSGYLTMQLPEVSLGGEARYEDGSVRISGITNFENAEIFNAEYNTKITGIGGKMPFQLPYEDSGEKGSFLLKAIDWNNLKIGTVSGTIHQNGLGVSFEGNHNSNLLPGLTLNFKGNAGYPAGEDFKTEVNFTVPRFNSNSVNLGKFTPEAEGILFSGELELDGNLFVDANGNIKCTMNTVVQNTNIELKEQGIAIEGINCTLSMPELFSMRSAQNQQFSFKKASFGSITFIDGKIGLQIESPEIIFVENCEFKWCNGYLYTHAMRIPLYGTDYDITLYCDRLELSQILDQFGIAKAEGSGTVSGRIPIKFAKRKLIIINDGFLYSTPGKGGIIHTAGTDKLSMGIPKNTPQFSQLDFAIEALKDFSYGWVTLSLNTEEGDLILRMSLNGKPMEPLPFTYDRSLGTFVRMQEDSKYGIDQPIQLDINFRLPVNKILYYGQGVSEVINILK